MITTTQMREIASRNQREGRAAPHGSERRADKLTKARRGYRTAKNAEIAGYNDVIAYKRAITGYAG